MIRKMEKMEIIVVFDCSSDNDENLIERFLSDYPQATYEVDENIIFKNDEWESIDDVDTFLCEEICHEYEKYCYICDDNIRKEYYYDEEDEWFEKMN
jgi:hypothetical protein